MEDSLKMTLKRMKANESLISSILGVLVIVVIAGVLIDYFRQPSVEPQITQESVSTVSDDLALTATESVQLAGASPIEEEQVVEAEDATQESLSLEPTPDPLVTLSIEDDEVDQLTFGDILAEASIGGLPEASASDNGSEQTTLANLTTRLRALFSSPEESEPIVEEHVADVDASDEADEGNTDIIADNNIAEVDPTTAPSLPDEIGEDTTDQAIAQETANSSESPPEDPQPSLLERLGQLAILERIGSMFDRGEDDVIVQSPEDEEADTKPDLPKTHTVMEGDTLWQIATEYYESGFNWVDIARINGLGDGDDIAVGQKITIPEAPRRGSDGQSAVTQIPLSDQVEMRVTIPGGDFHEVSEGETLWQISMQVYGDGLQWPMLYDANDNILASPDELEVGQRLRIPQVS